MNKKRTVIVVTVICICMLAGFLGRWVWKYYGLPDIPDRHEYESLEKRADAALDFAKSHNMNTHYAMFVDYGIPSGKPRLFVWDFHEKKVVARTYVMHGPGKGSTAEMPVFSNEYNSNCSALGRFKVTFAHGSHIKKSFKLKGMDIDNLSALNRGLMIHGAKWVDSWCWKDYIPLNEDACKGCVTVSSRGMDYIWELVNSENKNMLLWNYYSKN